MNSIKRFVDWCREPSRIKISHVRLFSIFRDRDKDDYLIVFSVLTLLFVGLIDWNVYSWLVLLATMILISGWYLRKEK